MQKTFSLGSTVFGLQRSNEDMARDTITSWPVTEQQCIRSDQDKSGSASYMVRRWGYQGLRVWEQSNPMSQIRELECAIGLAALERTVVSNWFPWGIVCHRLAIRLRQCW